jgi:urocanate hydratase
MKYSKLKDIVKYYEKNEEKLITGYTNSIHRYAGYQSIDCEGPFTPPTYDYSSFESFVVFSYSYKRYKRTLFKKGGGTFRYEDLPTHDLMKYVDSIIEDKITYETARDFWLYNRKDLITLNGEKLKTLLSSYKEYVIDMEKLETFIETI